MQQPLLTENHRIVWISGKGGVGKSLVSLGLAHREAQAGKKVLLVELGEQSYFQTLFRSSNDKEFVVNHTPKPTSMGFDIALWSGESCLREYILHLLKVRALYQIFFENKIMRTLINVAPGLPEIAITGKVTSGLRHVGPEMKYDRIIVDTFATGHALALWRAPKGLKEAIRFGPMGSHSRQIDEILKNPEICKYIIVTLLEELPVSESVEFAGMLGREISSSVEVIANRRWEFDIPPQEVEKAQESGHPLQDFAKLVSFMNRHQGELYRGLCGQLGRTELRVIPQWWSSDPQELIKKTSEALG